MAILSRFHARRIYFRIFHRSVWLPNGISVFSEQHSKGLEMQIRIEQPLLVSVEPEQMRVNTWAKSGSTRLYRAGIDHFVLFDSESLGVLNWAQVTRTNTKWYIAEAETITIQI